MKLIAPTLVTLLLIVVVFQLFFRYSYSYVEDPPYFGGVLRIDRLTGTACVSWGFATASRSCNDKAISL
jgi:hypothetical protein